MRNQTVVEVKVVREPMHQNDRRFLARVFPNIDPVLIPPNERFLADHSLCRKQGWV
jgi:hypothetical protein